MLILFTIVNILGTAGGYLRLLAPQRGLIAIVESQTRDLHYLLGTLRSLSALHFPAASKLLALSRAYY
jgi:hypothetical protein